MIFSGLMIPFLGTTLGAGMVFFMKGSMNQKLEKMLLGFAAGVMIAASVWSLLIPSIEMTEQAGGIAWIPACVGVTFAGVLIDNTGITLGCFCAGPWNCDSEFSRRGDYLNASLQIALVPWLPLRWSGIFLLLMFRSSSDKIVSVFS